MPDETAVSPSRRLIQITDLHLREQPGSIMESGVVTDESLRRVLADIEARESRDALVLVTGDLVQDPVPAAYDRLRGLLLEFPFRYLCLPGNHDDSGLMARVLAAPGIAACGETHLDGWDVLTLDSSVPGAAHGELGAGEIRRLQARLASGEAKHVLLAVHHQPVSIGSPWMDRMALRDSAELFEMAAAGRVRAVLFGHIHQELDRMQGEIRLLATPSTCVQFKPRTLAVSLDRHGPAWRWLDLYPDGRLETGVRYLDP